MIIKRLFSEINLLIKCSMSYQYYQEDFYAKISLLDPLSMFNITMA